ncbi:MAG TPA: hypothetical protein PLW07_06170, partial [bacterium]|nr:hypothetical protein [bacterium]
QGIDEYLTGLQNVFQMIKNSNHVKRFSTWLEYVKMVYESRQAELKGDFKSGIKIEERIQKFCEENQSYLKNYVTIKNVLEVSKISEQRFEEWLEKRKSSVYTM